MPRKSVFDEYPDLLEKAIQMYKDGYRIEAITKTIAISHSTVKKALIAHGVYKKLPDAIEERDRNILSDHIQNGLSFKQLSKKYNLCFSMIDRIVHSYLSDRKTLASEKICIENLLEQGWSREKIIHNTIFPEEDTIHILNSIMKNHIDQATKDSIIDDYIKGEKIQTIMNDYKISQMMLYRIIDEGGIERRRKSIKK